MKTVIPWQNREELRMGFGVWILTTDSMEERTSTSTAAVSGSERASQAEGHGPWRCTLDPDRRKTGASLAPDVGKHTP
jgi:hypothetical protein